MTCKDCIHHAVCDEIGNLQKRHGFVWYMAESGCPYFKDKSQHIETPLENKNDVKSAVDGLIQFRYSWCMNVRATEEKNEPVFRCDGCPFREKDGHCQMKKFINAAGTEEQKKLNVCVIAH